MSHRPSENPWDPVIGARVGIITGGLIGGSVALVTGWAPALSVLAGATLGALAGYRDSRR